MTCLDCEREDTQRYSAIPSFSDIAGLFDLKGQEARPTFDDYSRVGKVASRRRESVVTPMLVDLGIPGLSVPTSTHLCGFFRGRAERAELLFPYLREGLRAGDKCLCAYEARDRQALQSEVAAAVDVDGAGQQLDLLLSADIYLGRGDEFSPQEMLDFWDGWASASLNDGEFGFARAVCEMTHAVTEVIGIENLVRYEADLNRFVQKYPQVLLCLYDLDQFPGALIVDILKTHPLVLMGNTVLENLYYVDPDELATAS
jgi:hypothetical protein